MSKFKRADKAISPSNFLQKLVYSLFKSDSVNKKQIHINEADETDFKPSPEIPAKNKWLYPTDEFGEMEKGVVDL